MLRRIGAAGLPTINLADLKTRLKVDYVEEDAVINAMVATACDYVGQMAGRVLASETWEYAAPSLAGAVVLPKSPVVSLVSVTWLDATEVLQTATLSDFALISSDDWSMIKPKVGKSWPMAQADRADAVRVQFTAGYTDLPAALREAIFLMVGHLFRNREAVASEVMAVVPMSVGDLVNIHKVNWYSA